MTEPRNVQAGEAADPGAEVKPELIPDLEVQGDDAHDIGGGDGPVEYFPIGMQDAHISS